MSLKRNGPASGGAPDTAGGAALEGWQAAITGALEGAGAATPPRFESESDTFGTKEPTKPRRGAKERFPRVFGAPAAAPAAGAEPPEPVVGAMATFDAPGDDSGPLASVRGNTKRQAEPGKWEMYTVAELVRFRDEITRQLPSTELSNLNLEQEVLLQYHTLRELQADVLAEQDVPANQKATVANSVASILKALADKQESLYTSERFKDIENLLVRSLSLWEEADASKFLKEYEEILKNHVKS